MLEVKFDEHTHPILLKLSLLSGILVGTIGIVGALAVILGDFERPWRTGLFMVLLAFGGCQMAWAAWKGIAKRRALTERRLPATIQAWTVTMIQAAIFSASRASR